MFLRTVDCNRTVWQAAISMLLSSTTQSHRLSAEWAYIIIFTYISVKYAARTLARADPCSSYSRQVAMWCFWQRSPRSTACLQENMPRVGDNSPFYWQAFQTDQHLMGFIINSDDSFSLCLAFVGANKWRVDISQIASDWSRPSCNAKMEKGKRLLPRNPLTIAKSGERAPSYLRVFSYAAWHCSCSWACSCNRKVKHLF